MIVNVADLEGTRNLGGRLASALFPGAVLSLIGQLGAGKTHFVQAIAEGLGIENPSLVSSPTFVLIQEYSARLPIYHFDAYRLASENEFADLGVHEYFQGKGVCLVEWGDKVPGCLPMEHMEIRILPTGTQSRQFTLLAHGARYEEILTSLADLT